MKKTVASKQSSANTAQGSSTPSTNGSGISRTQVLRVTVLPSTGEIRIKNTGLYDVDIVMKDNTWNGPTQLTDNERILFVKNAMEYLQKMIDVEANGSKSGEIKNGPDTGSHS